VEKEQVGRISFFKAVAGYRMLIKICQECPTGRWNILIIVTGTDRDINP
jgi:hypothetical protein